ncbi:TPA: hypothetical protein G9E63_004357 [Salmonella enterica]|uniref:Uncharacterized protein n=1 Tax=Salmonella enterica TaxID=28901 RepID=A0A750H8K9_SALER|nr:transposase [Salmonella enterica subsp. enterica serovar Derby]EJC1546082.1 transposase [Salmonella enterica subsp. enterica serovar Montevideo]HAF6252679.1 hypothetical protein [Salmonella enterica]HAK3958922.1 hypothetical protein [Salmonella enterica]HAK8959658.1 hypothetical protein [Salmonella enterica]
MNDTLWALSYFAGNFGCSPLDIIKRYIEGQDRDH